MKKRLLVIALTTLGIMLLASSASANFSLSPGLKNRTMRFQIQANSQQVGYALLRNTGEEPIQVHLYANDGAKTNDGHFALKLPSEEQTGLGIWTTFEKSVYTLNGKEDREVPFLVTMPAGLPPGVYSGGLALEPYDEPTPGSTGGTSVEIKTRVVIPFFVEVPGEKVSELSFDSFTHQQTENNKVFFTMKFTNKGNTALIIKPKVEITSFGGLFNEVLRDNDVQLYMNESPEFRINLEKKPFIGFFDAKAVVSFYENDIINNEITYIGDKVKTISFVVIPWTTLFVVFAILLLVIILFVYHKKRLKKIIQGSTKYTVQAGDSLTALAKKNNVDWKLLAKINKLKAPYSIEENQEILIPSSK